MTRSTTPRRLLALLGLRFAGVAALMVLSQMVWPTISPLWFGLVGLVGSGLIVDLAMTQPAARRWLHEHAQELDRYVSP